MAAQSVVASPAARGALGSAVWGGVIGLLFLAPLLGMAVGAAAGGASGALIDVGVNDDFVRSLGQKLPDRAGRRPEGRIAVDSP